ncbi:uncharacterized protein LOC121376991 [Gigantopelta aegis]|uniref:uncharacterized protein LOC121376991 n=1 Tax=Gigantopelta aegis TaxID=1735272 RepID=UPI001B88B34B|nr:uncharacterized protein LOC121376991 [Gigantopelta aegis]
MWTRITSDISEGLTLFTSIISIVLAIVNVLIDYEDVWNIDIDIVGIYPKLAFDVVSAVISMIVIPVLYKCKTKDPKDEKKRLLFLILTPIFFLGINGVVDGWVGMFTTSSNCYWGRKVIFDIISAILSPVGLLLSAYYSSFKQRHGEGYKPVPQFSGD